MCWLVGACGWVWLVGSTCWLGSLVWLCWLPAIWVFVLWVVFAVEFAAGCGVGSVSWLVLWFKATATSWLGVLDVGWAA